MAGKKFLTAVSISILAGIAQGGIKPTVCPKVSLIQQKGVTRTLEIDTNLYFGGHVSHYKMDKEWIFIIGPVKANSEEEVLRITNAMLPGLSEGVLVDNSKVPICLYETGVPNVFAQAEEGTEMISANKARKRIQPYRKLQK